MPKLATGLNDRSIKNAKPKEKAYSLADGEGLSLVVSPAGKKSWSFRYRVDGKQNAVVIGEYPAMALAQARAKSSELRMNVKAGETISGARAERKARREEASATSWEDQNEDWQSYSLTAVSKKWLEEYARTHAAKTNYQVRYIVEEHFQPQVGNLDMRTLRSGDLTTMLRRMAADTPAQAEVAMRCIYGMIDYCIAENIREEDQRLQFRGVLPKKRRKKHIPGVTDERFIGELMTAIHGYGGFVVRDALLLCSWTILRPGVVASARWDEIDLRRAEWHIRGQNEDGTNRMKMGFDHIVPLPRQAVSMLREMAKLTGKQKFVFPPMGGWNQEHVHRDALSKALRDMGFRGKHTPHGFRASLRTLARERLKVDVDVLEAQLAHAKKDDVQAAYDRTQFLDERKAVMQMWADYLDEKMQAHCVRSTSWDGAFEEVFDLAESKDTST
ncbi:phage-related integrase [Bordetella ansorpii]|uniref:Phage-related integrase n=1 Tax=Bordetella ansorpii TaxID=288768 RepID=A0A146AC96_9BORD|nr:integrase arm-type DNA-binding domain-containing protein [Bordetella ansorpii]CZZ86635.1 phage-related integrase [Bordetella ansorpii]